MCVYKVTNQINGKIYVGKTKNTLAKRWRGHKSDASINSKKKKCYFQHAIIKYGHENFSIEEICKCSSEEDMRQKENYYILHLQSNNPDIGYNVSVENPDEPNPYYFNKEHSAKRSGLMKLSKNRNKDSGFFGVCYNKDRGKWLISFRHKTKNIKIQKRFDDKFVAARYHDLLTLCYFGEDYNFNFPENLALYKTLNLENELSIFADENKFKSESDYKGVWRNKDHRGKYSANITYKGKQRALGEYSSEIEAAEMADIFNLHLNKRNVDTLNFPEKVEYYNNFNYSPLIEQFLTNRKVGSKYKYIGVYHTFDKRWNCGRWKGECNYEGNRNTKGFSTEIEAAKYRDSLVVKFFGLNSKHTLNFPEDYPEYIQLAA